MSRSKRPPFRKTLAPLLGEAYAAKCEEFQKREARHLLEHYEQGWALADYQALSGVRALPPYEPSFAYQDAFVLPVASPLTDPEVFRASLSVRLEERVRLGVGFRNKPLLRAAAAPVVPAAVLGAAKVNVADLPWRVLHHHTEEILSLVHSPVLQRLGIAPDVSAEDIIDYRDYGILRLLRLILLAIWFEELQRDVETAEKAG